MDPGRLQASWARVVTHGANVPSFFYARLFLANPQLRDLFPISMAAQQDRLVGALGRIVSNVDAAGSIVPFVQQLGRDHRKFAVRPEHYPLVGEALLATLEYFLADEWTPELAADWAEAYGLVAHVMTEAATEAERDSPPWWPAEVVSHERRGLDIAVLWIRPEQAYRYRPGQSVALQTPLRPRVWRYFSPANAPRQDGLIELHVKAIPGGQVSNTLVTSVQTGDVLSLGPPIGTGLVVNDDMYRRDLLLLAGGTGLAPLKALVEQAACDGGVRRISLFVGARTAVDLYDMPALNRLATSLPWLTVVTALSHDIWNLAEQGSAVEVALRHGRWHDRDVYVCGSREMVVASVDLLRRSGIPDEQIHIEDYDADPDRPRPVTTSGPRVPADFEEARTW